MSTSGASESSFEDKGSNRNPGIGNAIPQYAQQQFPQSQQQICRVEEYQSVDNNQQHQECSDSDDCLTTAELRLKETNRAIVQNSESLDRPVFSPIKQWFMCEESAGSNVYYKAYITKITKTELKVYFPPPTKDDKGAHEWIKRTSSRVWRLSERQKYWKSLQYCGKKGAWQPKPEVYVNSSCSSRGGRRGGRGRGRGSRGGGRGAQNDQPLLLNISSPIKSKLANSKITSMCSIKTRSKSLCERDNNLLQLKYESDAGGGNNLDLQGSQICGKGDDEHVANVGSDQYIDQMDDYDANLYKLNIQEVQPYLPEKVERQYVEGSYQSDGQFALMKWLKLHIGIRFIKGMLSYKNDEDSIVCLERGQLSYNYISSQQQQDIEKKLLDHQHSQKLVKHQNLSNYQGYQKYQGQQQSFRNSNYKQDAQLQSQKHQSQFSLQRQEQCNKIRQDFIIQNCKNSKQIDDSLQASNSADVTNRRSKGLRELQGLSLWSWDKRTRQARESQLLQQSQSQQEQQLFSNNDNDDHSEDEDFDLGKSERQQVTDTQKLQLQEEEQQDEIENELEDEIEEEDDDYSNDEEGCQSDQVVKSNISKQFGEVQQRIIRKRRNNRTRLQHQIKQTCFHNLVIDDDDDEISNENNLATEQTMICMKPSKYQKLENNVNFVRSIQENNGSSIPPLQPKKKVPDIFVQTTIIHNNGNQQLPNMLKNNLSSQNSVQNYENLKNQIFIQQIDTYIDGQKQPKRGGVRMQIENGVQGDSDPNNRMEIQESTKEQCSNSAYLNFQLESKSSIISNNNTDGKLGDCNACTSKNTVSLPVGQTVTSHFSDDLVSRI